MTRLSATSPFLTFLLTSCVPALALAAPNTLLELSLDVVEILDVATFTLILFGLVMYFWALASNIPHFGDEKGAEKRKSLFFWGLVILFVMFSIWGIVRLLQNTLFGGNPFNPATGEPAVIFCDDSNCGIQ